MASGKKFTVDGEIEATKEITAMASTPASKVTLSQHLHNSAPPGPIVAATPGL
jgi:hypothetical protein